MKTRPRASIFEEQGVFIINSQKKKSEKRRPAAAVFAVAVIACVSLALAYLVFPVVQINGAGVAGFEDKSYLVLLNQFDYERGEVCCISSGNMVLIRRVIAKGGDSVAIDGQGNVTVNGSVIDEPYIANKNPAGIDMTYETVVPEGTYFVMGDDRSKSADSRDPAIGFIPKSNIVGGILFSLG